MKRNVVVWISNLTPAKIVNWCQSIEALCKWFGFFNVFVYVPNFVIINSINVVYEGIKQKYISQTYDK